MRFFVEEEWFYEMLKSKDAVDIRYNETDITHVFVRYKGIVHDPVPLSAARDELRTFSFSCSFECPIIIYRSFISSKFRNDG